MLNTIKKWLKKGGGKFIIIEDNEPKYVIMDISEYERLLVDDKDEELNKELAGIEEPVVEEEVLQ